MWRIFCFDEQMNMVDMRDYMGSLASAHDHAIELVKKHGWYTYAIGRIN